MNVENMSGPIVGRAQTLGDGVQTAAKRVICAVCDKTDKLSRCSRCKVVFYCTKEHQRRDWKRHREFCATHPAAVAPAEEPFSASAAVVVANNSLVPVTEIPSKRPPSLGNHRARSALVPNLNETLDAPRDSNVTSEPCRDEKRLAGTSSSSSADFHARPSP